MFDPHRAINTDMDSSETTHPPGKAEQDGISSDSLPERLPESSDPLQPARGKLKAVVVDDESHVRAILRDMLTSLNIEVVAEGSTGIEAVELFHTHQPDLMILDITMPVMSGEEVLMMLMPEFPDALIIVLTSMTDENSVDGCLDLGATNYIRKDTPIREIKRVIQETVNAFLEVREGQ